MNPPKTLRCAVYTRKSSEEGLGQEFNSLDAQREACKAYVKSQAGEGWELFDTDYEDAGFSGGAMERPGLQHLLRDIKKGQIDIVMVYKVDRLTRSLTDFAKIVETFESNSVSFVSVTQAFNTTTSMGRLTLNVLLSFAQFEREVIGERIRDKIAASKKKGIWMGGVPPLGYDVRDRKLIVNTAEAKRVRFIYQCYLKLRSVPDLVADLKKRGIHGKSWKTGNSNKRRGGFFPGARSTGSYGIPSTWTASHIKGSPTQEAMSPSFPRRFGERCRSSSLLKAENKAEGARPRTCSLGSSSTTSEIRCNTPTPPKMEENGIATT